MADTNDEPDRTQDAATPSMPARPKLKHRVEAVLLSAVVWIADRLGPDRASALMGWFWRRLAPYGERHRRADKHLAIALPELTARERATILADMWENLGRTAGEALVLPALVEDRGRFHLVTEGIEPHREQLERGAIFASLHMGNWELAGWGIHLAGLKVAAVYRPLSNPVAEAMLRARREPLYDGGLFAREAATAFRLRTLARQGVAVGMVADLRDPTGLEVPFFGKPALASALPAVLARRLGVPLVAGRVVRTNGANFRISAVVIDMPRTKDAEADILAGTAALTRQFEDWIRENPSQWMWAHRKWRQKV